MLKTLLILILIHPVGLLQMMNPLVMTMMNVTTVTSFMDSLSEDSLLMEDPHLNFSKGKIPLALDPQALQTQIKPKMTTMLRWVKMPFMCNKSLCTVKWSEFLDSSILEFWILDPGFCGFWILNTGSSKFQE
jgi:hypothetical protein